MKKDLSPFVGRPVIPRPEARELLRALSTMEAGTRMEAARIGQAAQLQVVRADAVAYVGKRAMHDVAVCSQMENQLSALVPLATARLQAIADMTSLGVAEVVSDTVRRVNR